jgi:hypothetical protein
MSTGERIESRDVKYEEKNNINIDLGDDYRNCFDSQINVEPKLNNNDELAITEHNDYALEISPDEHVVAEILRDGPKGRGRQLLVRWAYESLGVTWERQRNFVDVEAYHHYMRQRVCLAQEIDSPSVSEALF